MNVHSMNRLLLATALVAGFGTMGSAQDQTIELEIQKVVPGPGDVGAWFQKAVDVEGFEPSSHWMGVVVRPTDRLLQKHLKLEGGLVVEEVTPESPAAKAGLEADDILLAVNKTPVADMNGLMEFLTANEDKEATVWFLREGKKQSLKVTPVKRPEGHIKLFATPAVGEWKFEGKTPEEIRVWIEEMAKKGGAGQPFKLQPFKADGENPLKLRFFHPGVILGEGVDVDVDVDLPKGVRIMVLKQGDEPTKITVKRGDETWEVTEKDLDKLPEDIRAHVKKYLGGGKSLTIRAEAPKVLQVKPLEGVRVPRVQAHAHAIRIGDDGVEKKLDQINERLERIEAALEKLSEK